MDTKNVPSSKWMPLLLFATAHLCFSGVNYRGQDVGYFGIGRGLMLRSRRSSHLASAGLGAHDFPLEGTDTLTFLKEILEPRNFTLITA